MVSRITSTRHFFAKAFHFQSDEEVGAAPSNRIKGDLQRQRR